MGHSVEGRVAASVVLFGLEQHDHERPLRIRVMEHEDFGGRDIVGPHRVVAIVGASSADQAAANVDAAGLNLNPDEVTALAESASTFRST